MQRVEVSPKVSFIAKSMSGVEGMENVDVEKVNEATENVEEEEKFLTKFKSFLWRQYLPIGTVLSIIFGVFVPQPAVYVSEKLPLVKICIMMVFFCVGLRLRLHEAKSAVKSYKEVLVGILLVLFLGPVFATNVLNQIKQFGPVIGNASEASVKNASNGSSTEETNLPLLGPEEFRLALQILLMCPCAPASSLIMVTSANGHRGVCILVSVLCTMLAVFTVPPMLLWLIPVLQRINVNVGKLLLNTVIRILLPLLVGRGLRFFSPVKKVVKRWNNTIKYTGISFLIAVFLAKVSETSASGNLEKVSVLTIVCVVALGTSFTTFNAVVSYGFLTALPWFSAKSSVTLSILSSIRVVTVAATIVDVLPDEAGDKGLMTLPAIFVYLTTLIMLTCFISFTKVEEKGNNGEKEKQQVKGKEVKTNDVKEPSVNSKINEVAIFTIYSDEISVKVDEN